MRTVPGAEHGRRRHPASRPNVGAKPVPREDLRPYGARGRAPKLPAMDITSSRAGEAAHDAAQAGPRRIVVGVDGSEGSLAALRYALAEARAHGAQVHAVCAWHYPPAYGWAPMPDDWDLASAAEKSLRDALARVEEEQPPGEPVPVTHEVVEGQPALALLRTAADADLLVVGTRGHGGFMGLLLGSVSQQCVQHAPCPVVVVPPPRASAEPDAAGAHA